MKEINITEIKGIKIGQVENKEAATGLTLILAENGICAGLDVRGGGPAGRETQLLNPLMAADSIHGVLLGGGSAFGLDAAGGVMEYLEENDIGLDVGFTKVPLVVQTDIFDLGVGSSKVRPDKKMGKEVAQMALHSPNYQDGNYGAGTGATVGKLMGGNYCMKSGVGSYAVQIGNLVVGAVVVCNAVGNVYDWKTGEQLAGVIDDENNFVPLEAIMEKGVVASLQAVTNTTIGCIVTNGKFNKAQLCKIASMGHDGMARSIRPIHTLNDGDSLFALSTAEVNADLNMVGALAAECVSEAISRAVMSCDSAYGLRSYKSINK